MIRRLFPGSPWLWLGLCAAVLAPRAYLAVANQGMVWADEVYQTLEQGHRLAFGYGMVPWEFKAGARSWLLPGVIGGGMKALAVLGVKSGLGLAVAAKLGFALLSTLALCFMLRLAYAAAGATAVMVLGLAVAAFPASLLYGSRAMSEVACAPFLAWGVWLLWPWGLGPVGRKAWRAGRRPARPWWRDARGLLAAGALFGLASVLRYQALLLLPVVLGLVAWRRTLGAALLVGLGAGVVMGLGGLLDWATWGKPFASLVAYLRFNLVENGASQWGTARRDFYLRTLLGTTGPGWWVLALGLVVGLRRTWPVASLAAAFIGAHTAIAHKELRFVYPVLPLVLLCSAVGLAQIIDRFPLPRGQRLSTAALLGCAMAALFLVRTRQLTFVDLRQPMDSEAAGGPASPSVWQAFDGRNWLLSRAGAQPDICGLAVPAANPYWTGGYTYFHHRAPMLWMGGPPDYDAANYALLGPGQTMDDRRYKPLAIRGPYQLYRREGGCGQALRTSLGYGRLTPSGMPGT